MTGEHPRTGQLAISLLRWSKDNSRYMQNYSEKLPVNRKQRSPVVGAISSKKGAERYLDTAREMDLVTPLGREWQTTKIGHLLGAMSARLNPFELTTSQRFILLDVILRSDYLYLRTLIRMIVTNKLSNDSEHFKNEVISQIEVILKKTKNTNEIRDWQKVRENIRDWKDPERYFREQVKAPRLEWLVDLGLVTRWNQAANYFAIRPGSANFFSEPNPTDEYFDDTYASLYSDCFKDELPPLKRWDDVSPARRNQIIAKQLDRAMTAFKSGSIYRISASQFLKFGICLLLVENGIIASTTQLESTLIDLTVQSPVFRYVRMISEIDIGYIVKKKT